MTETPETSAKRTYHRRSDQERLSELQQKLEQMQNKLKEREEKEKHVPNPASKKIPGLIKRLREFAAYSHINGRLDYYNSTIAFIAMMDRLYHEDIQDPNEEPEIEEVDFDRD